MQAYFLFPLSAAAIAAAAFLAFKFEDAPLYVELRTAQPPLTVVLFDEMRDTLVR